MKVFVTGVGGQLGHDIMNELHRRGYEGVGSDLAPTYSGIADGSAVTTMPYVSLDITDKSAVERVISEINPDAVIHCAGWTAVDAAEDEDKQALVRRINVDGTKFIADACKKLGCKMLYLSTDYVFDGKGETPWQPDCKDYDPLNVYGQSKLDGKPLSVVGRKQYPQMDRVTGPDFMRRIFEESRCRKLRHYFYGNTAENLEKLIETIKVEYPHLEIVGYEPSVFRDLSAEEEKELAERINASHADFVWVGLGAPRQEILCARMKGRTDAVMVGVGGAFNVLAHIVPEAPQWMQKAGLEWLYRLIQEPRRLFKRYLVTNTKFLYYLISFGLSPKYH